MDRVIHQQLSTQILPWLDQMQLEVQHLVIRQVRQQMLEPTRLHQAQQYLAQVQLTTTQLRMPREH